MKFLLHKGLGYSTIHQIGNRLRAEGSGRHWIEKYRGDIFVNVSDDRDEAVLRNEFADLLDQTNNDEIHLSDPLSSVKLSAQGEQQMACAKKFRVMNPRSLVVRREGNG